MLIFITAGYVYGLRLEAPLQGAGFGLFLGTIFIITEMRLNRIAFGSMLGGVVGLGFNIWLESGSGPEQITEQIMRDGRFLISA